MSDQFEKADSSNLPKLENIMILEYMASSNQHNIFEIRGAKMLMSSRDSYVNSAVGYVQVRRTNHICVTKAKIVPEHKVSKKLYTVTCRINEQDDTIIDSLCEDCPASAGGCKHSLLLLFWLAKKTSEPSSTSIECYWNKPVLANASLEVITSKNIFDKVRVPELLPKNDRILSEFKTECQRRNITNSVILKFCSGNEFQSYNIFDMILSFTERETNHSYDNFKEYIQHEINDEVIQNISLKTIGQADCKYWHTMRQGRITASKIYEAAHCRTDGVLVEQILGGYKVPETLAIQRGKILESMVLKEIQEKLNITVNNAGFTLINGIIGASPDGVGTDFVVEIKCPISEKSVKSYIKDDRICDKYKAQVMCQMLECKKAKGLFCVADPLFETTKNVHVIWLDFDNGYINDVLMKAELFWSQYVYPKLLQSATNQ